MRNLNDSVTINNLSTTSTQAFDATNTFRVSAQAAFTDGAAAGTLTLQVSNDQTNAGNVAFDFTPTHWSIVATQTVTAGALTLIPSTELSYRWYRFTFASTGGAGTITVLVNSLGY